MYISFPDIKLPDPRIDTAPHPRAIKPLPTPDARKNSTMNATIIGVDAVAVTRDMKPVPAVIPSGQQSPCINPRKELMNKSQLEPESSIPGGGLVGWFSGGGLVGCFSGGGLVGCFCGVVSESIEDGFGTQGPQTPRSL
jgi:hypothetical protein